MKDTLLSLACAFALLFTACSKEELASPEEEEQYAVAFSVNSLSHDMVPMASLKPGPLIAAANSGAALPAGIDFLNYVVYNENGYRIADEVFQRGSTDFGRIKDFYTRGKYKVLVFGRRHQVYGAPMQYNEWGYFYNYELSDEVYFNQFDLEISDTDIEQDIELKRKVGKVEIEITGPVPQNVLLISYSITGVSEYFSPKTNRGDNTSSITRSYYLDTNRPPEERIGKGAFDFFFFLDEDEDAKATISMTAFDQNYNIVAQKEIENVPVGVNKKTILRGQLFESTGRASGQAFSVSY